MNSSIEKQDLSFNTEKIETDFSQNSKSKMPPKTKKETKSTKGKSKAMPPPAENKIENKIETENTETEMKQNTMSEQDKKYFEDMANELAKMKEENAKLRENQKKIRKAPEPVPLPKITIEDEESECVGEDMIGVEDHRTYCEKLTKADLLKEIDHLHSALTHLDNIYGVGATYIPYQDHYTTRPPKTTSGTKRTTKVAADDVRCEGAVWNNGNGGQCGYKGLNTLTCGRRVCKTHKTGIDKCVTLGEKEEDGPVLGWYDSFTIDRHNRIKPKITELSKKSKASNSS